jgi:SAM-dependent methyltransferase
MYPVFIEPYLNLALELAAQGKTAEALVLVRQSLRIKETPDNTALFVRFASALDAVGSDPDLRALVLRAATEGWERASDLAPLATTLTKHGAFEDAIRAADPALPLSELAVIAADPLLRWLMEAGPICDLHLERFLTATRTALLKLAETDPEAVKDDLLRFACALARQCFINEYVYALDDGELECVRGLQAAVTAAADVRAGARPAQIAVLAAYLPLHALPIADALSRESWPAPVAALIDQQIRGPRAEAAARATIPRLTPIDDDVSRVVQTMYEENPYPRWTTPNPTRRFESLDALIHYEVPKAPYRPTNKGGDIDILIAGCGTGRHSIMIAQQFEHARILAIDLSTASLGYAKARTEALGITNIDYRQADILRLGTIGRSFDMVQSVGVLHHLADAQGWRILLSLLRPGGVMLTGLYSETARRDVVAARAFIKEHGYESTTAGIRACRAALMAQPEGSPLREVARFNDFFTTSECRDHLFHVQENRTTLPEIKRFLESSGTRFLGFQLEPTMLARYAARFPDDPEMTNLDNWHAFEQDMPYTFASMYRFWIQKTEA